MKELLLQQVTDFSEHFDGREIVTVSVGPNSEAFVLAVAPGMTDERFIPYVQPGWTQFWSYKSGPFTAHLLKFSPDFKGEIIFPNGQKLGRHFQPLSNNEILVVEGRCRQNEKNASVYEANGELKRQFFVSDGIADVQVANDSTIWVSYFDEGVFSGLPLSASGLARFDAQGKAIWQFESSEDLGLMADCYAMNVAHDATWIYYYTDFPIVRIKPDNSTGGWKNEFIGARALITDNHRVLLFGGYQEHRNRCVVQEFGDDKMMRAREIKLILPDNENKELPERVRAIGRGSTLHLFIGTIWYQLDLAEVDA